MTGELAGQIALVTGGASGIGAACARLLVESGAKVCCADLDSAGASALAVAIGDSAMGIGLDVTVASEWDAALTALEQRFGPPSVLVHAAGISAATPIAETSLEEWRKVLSVNLDGAFLATSRAVRAMRSQGGSIVLIGSASGVRPSAGAAAYSVSKAGLVMLARTAAKECRELGLQIRINVVSPGGVKTPLWRSMPFFQELVAQHGSDDAAFAALAGNGPPFAEPEDVARLVCHLASPASRQITGVDVLIDGGYVL